jgi:endonuclease/exonuclease/phosphatase family metal-dependent hydrolase
MTAIVTWNIQYGLGCDGCYDLKRIVETARAMGPMDLFCVQEVAVGMPEMDQGKGEDQAAALAALLPEFAPVFRPALDFAGADDGRRRQFGNMILSRLPVIQVIAHPLPQPAAPGVKHMRRQALEVVVDTGAGPLRIGTTHLEFHSEAQRMAQVDRLRELHGEASANERRPALAAGGTYVKLPRPSAGLICGDFNFPLDEAAYARMLAPFAGDTPALLDAWTVRHGNQPHDPTCGIHDAAQWPQGPHARDFIFISAELAGAVREVQVDTKTNASDHQPVRLVLDR